MKLRFYMDIWPGMSPTYGFTAMTQPHKKSSGVRRISFDVFVPDEMLHDSDHHLSETPTAKVAADYDDHQQNAAQGGGEK